MDSSAPPVEPAVVVVPPPVEPAVVVVPIDVDEIITVDVDEIEELVRTPPRRRKRKTSGTDVAVREEAVKQYHRLIRNGWFPCAAADEIGSKFKCTGQTVRNWIANLKKISTTPCGSKRISKGRKNVQSPLYLARCEEVRSVIAKALAQLHSRCRRTSSRP